MHSSLAVTCVSGDKMHQMKGGLQNIEGLLQTSARADSKKGAAICGMTSRCADYMKT
jgi:hypothetical protein